MHALGPKHFGGISLLLFAKFYELLAGHTGVIGAFATVGNDQIMHFHAFLSPASYGAGGGKVNVIGMCTHGQHNPRCVRFKLTHAISIADMRLYNSENASIWEANVAT